MDESKQKMPRVMLIFGFLMIVFGVGATQAVIELAQRERPQCLDVFVQAPSERNLRAYEQDLEDSSWFVEKLRPWTQFARFVAIGDTGDKALMGREGWFFYKPDVQYLVEPLPNPDDALTSIVSFRDRLGERGIKLLVVPALGKGSVYPDKLTARLDPDERAPRSHTTKLIRELRAAGIEVVDLAEVFVNARRADDGSALYLTQDTHWSPAGMEMAAHAVAERLVELGWTEKGNTAYKLEASPLERCGDVITMMRSPQTERLFRPEAAACSQVVHAENGEVYKDSADSEILVMGDSFLRIYERDEPGSAGFISHLAAELNKPLTSIVNDGGASTLVRQELHRKPELLANKKVVVWEFVERDVRFGTEGWQDVPLPKPVEAASRVNAN